MTFGKLVVFFPATVIIFAGCFTANQVSTNENVAALSPTHPSQNIQQVGDSKFIKTDGWAIPSVDTMRRRKSGANTQRTEDGNPIEVSFVLFYAPNEKIITFEPFNTIGYSFGISIESLTKCDVRGSVFEIEIKGIIYKTHKDSGKPVPVGPATFYRYYDEDGDGLFETLVMDSSAMPVPKWAEGSH